MNYPSNKTVLDHYLLRLSEWTIDLIQEGLCPPTQSVLETANKVAEFLDLTYQHHFVCQRVVPNGEGGLIFEFYDQVNENRMETIEIPEDLTIQRTTFADNRMNYRITLSLEDFLRQQ